MMSYNEFAGYRETIESLRQQLASRDAEVAEFREQVVMLRDVMCEVLDAVWLKTSHELASKFSEALAATEQKP